jgi:hypothetical protein
MCDFGDTRLFIEEYKDYIPKELRTKAETYMMLSEAFRNLEEIIPEYLDVNIIYLDVEDVPIPRMDKILELISD